MSGSQYVIIGASHAGAQIAATLRQNGWQGGITLIGEEPVLPYHRPPLSKTYLAGQKHIDDILIRPAKFYEQNQVHAMLGDPVASIDRSRKVVVMASGAEIAYDKLALATGARVRKITIPGIELDGVCYLRNATDVDQIRPYATPGKKAVIVGGGYIGLETAAALREVGMEVTVLEALPRVLQRVTAPEVSAFYSRIHAEQGVKILTDTAIECIKGDTAVHSVVCQGGTELPADLVVIGVGILPETTLAEQAGLEVNNGIVVDEHARTSDPDIVAAGDCTWHYNPIYDRHLRLESVQNAVDQAKVAANTLCGKPQPYNALPWFWSDQYDLKLQIAGLSQGYDQVIIRGGIEHERNFSAFYLREGQLIAVDAVNRPKDFIVSKRALVQHVRPDLERLADQTIDIQEVLAP